MWEIGGGAKQDFDPIKLLLEIWGLELANFDTTS